MPVMRDKRAGVLRRVSKRLQENTLYASSSGVHLFDPAGASSARGSISQRSNRSEGRFLASPRSQFRPTSSPTPFSRPSCTAVGRHYYIIYYIIYYISLLQLRSITAISILHQSGGTISQPLGLNTDSTPLVSHLTTGEFNSLPECLRTAHPPADRARHGHYTLIKPLDHWKIQFSPRIFTGAEKVPELRAVCLLSP
eukprot:7699856-Pyramimonas_sp.AAC.1